MEIRDIISQLTGASANAKKIEDELYGASTIPNLSRVLTKFRGLLKKGKDAPSNAAGLLEQLMRDLQANSAFTPESEEDTSKLSDLLDAKTSEFAKAMGISPGAEQGAVSKEGNIILDQAKELDNPTAKGLSEAQKKTLASAQKRYEDWAARTRTKTSFNDILVNEGFDVTSPGGVAAVNDYTKNLFKTATTGSAGGTPRGKVAPLDLTPSFRAKLGPLGVSNIGDLGELTAHGKLPPELVAALNKHATGNPEDLRQYLQATGDVPPEVVAAAQARKSLQGVPEQFAQLKQKLQEAERTIGESGILSEKKKLAGVKKLLSEMEGVEESGDPTSMRDLLQRAKKGTGRDKFLQDLITPQAAQQRIGDIKAAAEEGNALGFGGSAANSAEQNLARLRKAAEQLKAGAKGAAADLLEGPAKFGATSPLVENLTKAAKGTKIAPDVAKSVSELKALLAEGEPGIKAWLARAGGVKGVLKGPVGIGIVLPLLFEAYQRLSASTDQRRQREEISLQRESLPTVQNLLETYKAQRFAQQGVNNEAPDPRIVQALQRMGPQLTNSEVAIGPDRTMDNVLALRERLTQE